MLDYGKLRSLTYFVDNQEEVEKKFILDEINLRLDRLAKKEEKIKTLEYEKNLILNDICAAINTDLRNSRWNLFSYFNVDIFWKAWKYCHYKEDLVKNKEIKKDEYRTYESSFGYTKDHVARIFFGDDLKDVVTFKTIMKYWETGYEYVFNYKDQEITIFIPTFMCDQKTYEDMLNGYHASYRESESCTCWITHDLDYHKVAQRLQEWLKNEEWKKKDE